MKIEKPWEELYCEKCIMCFQDDMCIAHMLGTSYAYCPQIRNCERFKEVDKCLNGSVEQKQFA